MWDRHLLYWYLRSMFISKFSLAFSLSLNKIIVSSFKMHDEHLEVSCVCCLFFALLLTGIDKLHLYAMIQFSSIQLILFEINWAMFRFHYLHKDSPKILKMFINSLTSIIDFVWILSFDKTDINQGPDNYEKRSNQPW